jgi:shikimate kinase
MGTGKSEVGRVLAKRLKIPFVDLDHRIEREAQLRIADIFSRYGEKKFRQLERKELLRVSQTGPAVVALGGGALLDEKNRTVVIRTGTLVRLTCSRRELVRRLKPQRSIRPLLSGGSLEKKIAELMNRRRGIDTAASLSISTTSLTPAQISMKIAQRLQ